MLEPYNSVDKKQRKSSLSPDVHKKYLVTSAWYNNYKKIPGFIDKVQTSPLINSKGDLIPTLQEGKDYKVLSESQWEYLSNKYGAEKEVVMLSRNSYRSVSSGGYSDETPKAGILDLEISVSLRKRFNENYCKSCETNSKLTSMDSEKHNFFLYEPSCKIGLEMFNGSDCFNSALQLLFTVSPLVDFFNQNALSGEFFNSPFLVNFSTLMMCVTFMHSGVIKTCTLFESYKVTEKEPGLVVEKLIQKLDLELGRQNFMQSTVFNGVLNVENLCLTCQSSFSYQMGFTNLNLACSKSVTKGLDTFARCKTVKNYCDSCGKDTDLQKKIEITGFPSYLVIVIKRWEEKKTEKKYMQCTYRRKLSLDAEYRLVSVIAGTFDGYLVYCKRKKSWYQYENEKYFKINASTAMNSIAHVLLYKRVL